MQKTNIISCAVLAIIANASFSGTMGPVAVESGNNAKEGAYFGAGFGGSFYNDKVNVINPSTLVTRDRSFNISEAQANVFLGYGQTFDNLFYLGAEANSYFPHRNIKYIDRVGVTAPGLYDDIYTVSDYINLDLLPGYRISPSWLIYGRAGLSFSNITLNQPVSGTVFPHSSSGSSVGGRFGAGITYELSKHVSTSVDYFYSYNPSYGIYWENYNTQYNLKSSANYVGVSLAYTI